jgi:protein required for attachment to host cells
MPRTIPHNAVVLVADGKKAIFLRNEGVEKFANLQTERVLTDENPATHVQGTERPRHTIKSLRPTAAPVWSPADWHDIEAGAQVRPPRGFRIGGADAIATY